MYRDIAKKLDEKRRTAWWRVASALVVALVFSLLLSATFALAAAPAAPVALDAAQSAPDHGGDDDDDDDLIKRYGVIVTRSVEASGTWVIGEISYTVSISTELIGELEPGVCVEVQSLQSDPLSATRIEAKDAFKCHDDDDDDDDDDDVISRHGVIVTRSVENSGTWVIGEKVYSVTEETELVGLLEVGTCVEVKSLKSDPATAIKIEAKDAFKCDDDDDDDHDDKIVAYGFVRERPEDGRVGTWIIGGVAYSVTEETDFDFDYGRLDIGSCAKVKTLASDPTVAIEIESEKNYKCGDRDDDDNARATIFGIIEQLPPDLENGIWLIGGLSFVVSPTTELVSHGLPFTPGITVKVDFTTNMSDTNFAHRIEIKFGHDNPCRRHNSANASGVQHGGDDDHHSYGHCPGREGKTIGIIDERPAGELLGNWMIGGIPYVANAFTKFHPGDDFLQGEWVKVEYVVVSDTLRYATKIKEFRGGSDPDSSFYVGFVDEKPLAFVGHWVINGAPFEAVSTTVFIEHGSLFAVGAYVVVEYDIVNDMRLISKILTYVPPGAGDANTFGVLQSVGTLSVAAVASPLQAGELWTVNGVDFVVNEATQLVDSGGELALGAYVYVNSYEMDGQRYATMIRTQSGKQFIPLAASGQ